MFKISAEVSFILVFACILVKAIVMVFLFFHLDFFFTCWIFSDRKRKKKIDGGRGRAEF